MAAEHQPAGADPEERGVSRRWVALAAVGLIGLGLGGPLLRAATRDRPEDQVVVEAPRRPDMVRLPGGRFVMGSPPDEPGHDDDEDQLEAELAPFIIARTEVTQAQWVERMGRNPSFFQGRRGGGPDHPVERVSVWDALAYLNARSAHEGFDACYDLAGCDGDPSSGCEDDKADCPGARRCPRSALTLIEACDGYRLPTEAEWEYAARAGTTTPLFTGNITLVGLNNAPAVGRVAWYGGNSSVETDGFDCSGWKEKEEPSERCGTHPVAAKPENPWGLHDVLGNVWEWTGSWGSRGISSEGVVFRGCGWNINAEFCRAAARLWSTPGLRFGDVGFRPARSVPRPSNP